MSRNYRCKIPDDDLFAAQIYLSCFSCVALFHPTIQTAEDILEKFNELHNNRTKKYHECRDQFLHDCTLYTVKEIELKAKELVERVGNKQFAEFINSKIKTMKDNLTMHGFMTIESE